MKLKKKIHLLLMAALICMPNEQVYAVKLSTWSKIVGACTILSVATLVGLDIAFELQDVMTVYHPVPKFKQELNFISDNVELLSCNSELQLFSDQVKAGTIDHVVITVNPLWFGYKGNFFDRRHARIRQLFNKAKELAPCVIVVEENEFTPLFLSQLSKFQATASFIEQMRMLEESSALILVDEVLVDIMMEQLHEDEHEFTKNVLTKNVTEVEKIHYLETKFQHIKISADIDASLAISLMQKTQYSLGKLIKFVSLAQDHAVQDNADMVEFKHFYKANRADQSYLTNLEQQIYVACNGGKKRSAYHESAHAMLGAQLDIGMEVLGMSILPYLGSGGHVSYSEPNQTKIQKQNFIMVCLAGGVTEQEFGIPKKMVFKTLDEAFNDFSERPGVFADLVTAYRMAFDIVVDQEFENEEIKTEHVHSMIKDVYAKTVSYVHEYRLNIQKLAEAVLQKEILSANEIRQLII